jgi:hypothetical protein
MKTLRGLVLGGLAVGLWLASSSLAQPRAGRFQEEELAALRTYLHDFAVSKQVVNGNVYIFGGVDRDGKVSDRIFRYALFTGEWNELPQRMPYPYTSQNASAVLGSNGKVYLGPGFSSSTHTPTHAGIIEFDPASGNCVEIHGFDFPRGDMAVEQGPDGMVYFFGGWDGLGKSGVYEFKPATGEVKQVADLGFARGAISAIQADDGNIYLFGGNPSPSVIEMFDTKEKRILLRSSTVPTRAGRVESAPLVWGGGDDRIYLLLPGTGEVYVYDCVGDGLVSTAFRLSAPPVHESLAISRDGKECYLFVGVPSDEEKVRFMALRFPLYERTLAGETALESESEVAVAGVERGEVMRTKGIPLRRYANISQVGAMVFLGKSKGAKTPFVFENISALHAGNFDIGLGYGYHLYDNGWVVPGYLHLNANFFREGFSPSLHFDAGYGYGRASRTGTDFSGLILGGGLGFRIPVSERSAWVINGSYRLQKSNKSVDLLTFKGAETPDKLDYRMIVVSTGLSF